MRQEISIMWKFAMQNISSKNIFEFYSAGFAGPLLIKKTGKNYLLIDGDHLTGWSIAVATADSSSKIVIKFIEQELMHIFNTHRNIISDNYGSCSCLHFIFYEEARNQLESSGWMLFHTLC